MLYIYTVNNNKRDIMNIDINNYRAVIDEINDAMTKSEKVEIINKYGLNCAPQTQGYGAGCL